MRTIFVLYYFTELFMIHFIAIEQNLLFPCKTKAIFTVYNFAYRISRESFSRDSYTARRRDLGTSKSKCRVLSLTA